MPTVVRSREVQASPAEVWELVSDPAQLPRWWPRVERVEEATPTAWTKVMRSPRGRTIRADFTRTAAERPRRLAWRQEVEESPFERVFAEIATEISIEGAADGGSRVELTAIHRLRGRSRFGGFTAWRRPRSCRPARTRRWPGCCRYATERASRSCRSGAVRAWSAALTPSGAASTPRSRSTWRAWTGSRRTPAR